MSLDDHRSGDPSDDDEIARPKAVRVVLERKNWIDGRHCRCGDCTGGGVIWHVLSRAAYGRCDGHTGATGLCYRSSDALYDVDLIAGPFVDYALVQLN